MKTWIGSKSPTSFDRYARSNTKSKENVSKAEDSMRTKAKRFIQNEFSSAPRKESLGNTKNLRTMTNQKKTRDLSVGAKTTEVSDTCFCTDGADSSHYDNYIIGKRIGQGAYAVVRAGINNWTSNKVAIKIYDKTKLQDSQRRKGVRREIKILERIRHQNIIELYEAFDTKKQVFLVMENVSGGSLHSLLKSRPNRQLKDSEAKSLFLQVASAVKYCHSKNITHRDIKLENILLDEKRKNVKLIDFGFSTWIPNDKKIKMFWGTPSYMAPEIVSKQEFCGPPADIWALGVLLYALLCGKFPFKGKTDEELYSKINNCSLDIPQHVSFAARWLLERMMTVNADHRITASEIWRDSWLVDKDTYLKDIFYQLNGDISCRMDTSKSTKPQYCVAFSCINQTINNVISQKSRKYL